jgi:N-hydroxyarylamine O-acetyltransferase
LDVGKTLERINHTGSLETTLEVLRDLQRAFLFTVPFENLDIHAGVPIVLEPGNFYRKIVLNRRGGFCYECNSLFHDLLRALGFDVVILSARMTLRDTNSPGYSHMALMVSLDRPYLVDVGNGQSVLEPVPIPGDESSPAEGIAYRVGEFGEGEYALYFQSPGEDWRPRFVFSLTPRDLGEFSGMCHYHQTSPDSIFTQQRICTLPLTNGRVTLTGDTLTLQENGAEVLKIRAGSPGELAQLLQKYFNIDVQPPDLS